jgi:hypothetical protein
MKRLPGLFASILMFSALLLPLRAHADNRFVTKAGVGHAGMINGTAYFVVQPWDGSSCEFIPLGTNGLDRHYKIYGTPSMDLWTFVGNTMSFCGWTMTPVNQNGWHLDFDGQNGDDILFGGFHSNYVNGGDGNDAIRVASAWDAEGHGWGGNDQMLGNRFDGAMWGHWDNDRFCVPRNAVAGFVSGGGGAGWDTLCGSADNVLDIDNLNDCSGCP